MTALPPFAIVVGDGMSLCTIQPPALGAHRAGIEAALADVLGLKTQIREIKPAPVRDPEEEAALEVAYGPRPELIGLPPKTTKSTQIACTPSTSTMVQTEIARASGYSGNCCASCGSFQMKRSGTCETCEGCGGTSGGCS